MLLSLTAHALAKTYLGDEDSLLGLSDVDDDGGGSVGLLGLENKTNLRRQTRTKTHHQGTHPQPLGLVSIF